MKPLVTANIEKLRPYAPGKPIEETEREYGVKDPAKLASKQAASRAGESSVIARPRTWISRWSLDTATAARSRWSLGCSTPI